MVVAAEFVVGCLFESGKSKNSSYERNINTYCCILIKNLRFCYRFNT